MDDAAPTFTLKATDPHAAAAMAAYCASVNAHHQGQSPLYNAAHGVLLAFKVHASASPETMVEPDFDKLPATGMPAEA